MNRTCRLHQPVRLLAVLALLAAASGCASANETRAATRPAVAGFDQALHDSLPAGIRDRAEVRVATDAAYPPASGFAADGRTIEGFEPDLGKKLGRVLGISFTFVPTPFADALPALEDGKIDLIMSAMTDTPERQAKVDFVDYFSAGTSIVVQRGNPRGITDLRDLCGQSAAVEAGSIQVELLERTGQTCNGKGIEIREFRDYLTALLEVRTGRAAAALGDYPPAAHVTTQSRTSADFQLASTTQYEPGFYGIAVRKDQTALRDALQEALGRVIRSGEYADVLAQWGVSGGAVTRATVNAGALG